MVQEKGKIFVVEDDEESLKSYVRVLTKAELNADVYPFASSREALESLEHERDVDLVVTDLRMPEIDGLGVLKRAKELNPETEVLLITGYGSIDTAVEAMKIGAADFIEKPIAVERFRNRIKQIIEKRSLAREVSYLKARLNKKYGFSNIIGSSKIMESLFEQMRLIAPAKTTVLIMGGSGTGKELIANAIHENSPRAGKRFLPINCTAIPSEILESELFGHEKGSFTGAVQRKIGKFELAHGGTIFLDEIGDLTPDIQVKLLRVLEEREFMRVGGSETIRVDVRVIAATNTDLEKSVAGGSFRSDLYYRLKVITLKLPLLRERREDIPLLTRYFFDLFCKENNKPSMEISPEAMDVLIHAPWEGNVRELKNLIESLVVLSQKNRIEMTDLPPEYRIGLPIGSADTQFKVGMTMEEIEKLAILQTLEKTGGNRSRAAEILGIGLRTLHRKLKEYRGEGGADEENVEEPEQADSTGT